MRNIPTELILLEIVDGIQSLMKNPELLQSIRDAYAFSQVEKEKYEQALEVMKNADQFLADVKKKEEAYLNVEDRIAQAEQLAKSNFDAGKELERVRSLNERQAYLNDQDAEKNLLEAKRLSDFEIALNKREAKLNQERDELEKQKSDLKKRADIVSATAAGL